MNRLAVNTLIFLGGAMVGGISTYLRMRHHFSERLEREVEEIRMVYDEKVSTIEPPKSTLDGEIEGPEVIDEKIHLDKTKASYSQYLNNKPPLKDYTSYFKEKDGEVLDLKEVTKDALSDATGNVDPGEVDPAELEGPMDDEPYTDEEDENETLEFEDHQLNGEHKKAMNEGRDPYEIDAAAFELECSNYEKQSLCYYISDDVLVEEMGAHQDEVNRFSCIGDILSASGFDENDEEIIYVRNDVLMCDYEITKVYTPYEPLGR